MSDDFPTNVGSLQLEGVGRFAEGPFNFLVYGGPGVGKTTLAATADDCENMRPVVYLHTKDGGPQAVAYRGDRLASSLVTTFAELESAILQLGMKEHPFKTVILDSLTGAHGLIKRNIAAGKKGGALGHRGWGDILDLTLGAVETLCDLDMHVICTAHVKERKKNPDDEDSPMRTTPFFEGQAVARVAHMFDMVGHMFVDEGEEVPEIVTAHTNLIQAKNRLPDLPHPFMSPTFPKILKALDEGKRAYLEEEE